jgi:hypothetical protein
MASIHWGRKETIIFPPHCAIYTYGAVLFAVILTGLFVYLRFTFGNTPLQRFYTPIYIRSSVAGSVSALVVRNLLLSAQMSMQCLSCHLDRIEAADGDTVSLLRYYLEDSAATVVDGMALGRILGPRAGETAQ